MSDSLDLIIRLAGRWQKSSKELNINMTLLPIHGMDILLEFLSIELDYKPTLPKGVRSLYEGFNKIPFSKRCCLDLIFRRVIETKHPECKNFYDCAVAFICECSINGEPSILIYNGEIMMTAVYIIHAAIRMLDRYNSA